MKKGFGTRVLHAGKNNKERGHNTPIYPSASFAIRNEKELELGLAGKIPLYHRHGGNPTIAYPEKKICELEGGARAYLRADGMNAVSMSFHGALSAGSHLIVIGPTYGRTTNICYSLKERWGCDFDFFAASDPNLPEKVLAAINEKTVLVFGEITTNPTLAVWDVPAIAAGIRRKFGKPKSGNGVKKPILIVDASFTSPYNFRAFEHGADVVVHSATKYLGGHGAFTLGFIVVSRRCLKENPKYWENAVRWAVENGGTPSVFDAELLGLFMETLHLRMASQNYNAAMLARFLEHHPAVLAVSYPGLESNPQHELAKRLLSTPSGLPGYGGMVSFRIKGGLEAAKRFLYLGVKKTFIKHKPSLGYTKTIVESPELLSQGDMPEKDKLMWGITEDLIRVSVGTEDIRDIIEVFNCALNA